jgi:flavin-dependent dehydrogenase
LANDIVSVGVVGDLEDLIAGRSSPEQTLDEQIAACVTVAPRVERATRASPVHVLSDFSFRSTRCAGEGWVLVGDAFGFLDPIYSSGVHLALKSGEMAADCIIEGLACGDLSAGQLGRWGRPLNAGMQAIRKLVYAFYTRGFSFGRFMRQHPQWKRSLVDLLVGDVFRPDPLAIFETMSGIVPLPDAVELDQPRRAPVAAMG